MQDAQIISYKEATHVPTPANMDADDSMRGLIKLSFDIYDKPIEIKFDGSKFEIIDGATLIFLTFWC